jgi:regulator of protease activity HflC (stomatin/prohibitin superfamily)
MFYIVIALLLLVVVAVSLAGSKLATTRDGRAAGKVVAGVALGVLLLLTFFCSVATIGARSLGVETAFGKYHGTVNSGWHFKAPYASIEQFSTRVQYLHLEGDTLVPITYKGGGGGSVRATVRWRITESGAKNLWQKYRSFDNVRDNLLVSASKDSFRVILGNYAPNDAIAGENLRPISEAVQQDLDQTLRTDGIVVDSISIQHVALDPNSQAGLNQVVKANADIQRAKVEQQRAIIDAKTAEIRRQGGTLTPDALTRYCLEVVNAWDVHKNGPLPAGFTCFGAGNPFVVTNK